MSLNYKPILAGDKELLAILASVPDRIQNRVIRTAQRKVGKAVADRARQLAPRRKVGAVLYGPQEHFVDRITSVQRVYRSSGTVVTIVGAQTGGRGRIAHIIEFGTNYRYTHHKTNYTRTVGFRTKKKRIKTAGGWRTVVVREKVISKKSIGSTWQRTGLPDYRGRMPAFHPIEKAVEQTQITDIYENELRNGLQRIADRSAN